VTNAIYEAGFGSSSRGYEGAQLGMTPARFAQGGKGEQIGWARGLSPFGWVIVGATARGLCWLALAAPRPRPRPACARSFRWPRCGAIRRSRAGGCGAGGGRQPREPIQKSKPHRRCRWICAGRPFSCACGRRCADSARRDAQLQPVGARAGRSQGDPRRGPRLRAESRGVLVVPCHRVVGASGSLTGYRWGVERKRQLLEATGWRA
jgi:AraC family transcriptional regulator of adaptative response/methylated-DNA-[protein]-cysteine methyltransferase